MFTKAHNQSTSWAKWIQPFYFLKKHFNNILPSISCSSKQPLPFSFWSKLCVHFLAVLWMPHAPPSQTPWLHPNNSWTIDIMRLFVISPFLQPPVNSTLFGSHILLSTLFSNVRDKTPQLIHTPWKIIVLYISSLNFRQHMRRQMILNGMHY